MSGSPAELAIESALRHGNALAKFIAPNDTKATKSHQAGFLLPTPPWRTFTNLPPVEGKDAEEHVKILWFGANETASRICWHGAKKHEYRLTRFGDRFPFREAELVGDLLILVRTGDLRFEAYVVTGDDQIDQVLVALDIEVGKVWGVYTGHIPEPSTEERVLDCLTRRFESFAIRFRDFPDTTQFSHEAVESLRSCNPAALNAGPDETLMHLVRTEYDLFRHVERKLCSSMVTSGFASVDDFLKTASSIMNRRKSRAGRSLENHFSWVLTQNGIPHKSRPAIEGRPDVVIPDERSYEIQIAGKPPVWILGVKSTCKDRWRQVLQEARKVRTKFLVTVQPAMSSAQIADMMNHDVRLVVPREVRRNYSKKDLGSVLTVQGFIKIVREGRASHS
ncbi:MAG: hypothetical protein IT452_20265 [Planctomycetia bacterium]|nr:hypothetical protein [Planctomycetia bacterium]